VAELAGRALPFFEGPVGRGGLEQGSDAREGSLEGGGPGRAVVRGVAEGAAGAGGCFEVGGVEEGGGEREREVEV